VRTRRLSRLHAARPCSGRKRNPALLLGLLQQNAWYIERQHKVTRQLDHVIDVVSPNHVGDGLSPYCNLIQVRGGRNDGDRF